MTRHKSDIYIYSSIAVVGVIAYVFYDLIVALVVITIACLVVLRIKDGTEESSPRNSWQSSHNYRSKYSVSQQNGRGVSAAAVQFIERVITERNGLINSNELLQIFNIKVTADKTLHKIYLDKLIQELRRLGYEIVPNYELGHKRLDYNEPSVLYKSHTRQSEASSPLLHQGELFVKLFSVVLSGKKVIPHDIEYIARCVSELRVSTKYHNYLRAYLLWLQLKKQPFDRRTKDEVAELPKGVKAKFVMLLLEGVSTNGIIDNDRLESLKKILPTLGVDVATIHSLLHQSIINAGLATVEQCEGATEYAIRQPDEEKPARTKPSTIILDERKLGDLRQQTQVAHELLSDIFEADEETPTPAATDTSNAVIEVLQKLLERDSWQRDEVQSLLGANIMIGSMLERINDYAYSKIDDIVVEEDGDTIYVTTEYKDQLI